MPTRIQQIPIAVIREDKQPPDARVPLSPRQVAELRARGLDIVVQPSSNRCFTDTEYRDLDIPLQEDLADRELLLGIKEVPINCLLPGKTYCNFAHVAKFQPYNQALLRALLDRRITHIDYEYLTDDRGARLIAFGYWAGMVGAHNGVWAYGKRTGKLELPRLKDLYDYAAAQEVYRAISLPEIRVVLTGTGRVGCGAARVLKDLGFREVAPAAFLEATSGPVFTQLAVEDYAAHPSGRPVDRQHFYAHAEEYVSTFDRFARRADIFINGIFWDGKAPAFFTREMMQSPDFAIATIADITCDIAPAASVPSTLKASTIANPVFGYDPATGTETAPFQAEYVDVMSIDNLPSELPRDASEAFGSILVEDILPEFDKETSDILRRATITHAGNLGPEFTYLSDFAAAPANE
ncbi:alanine dehydrogenase [Neolewinella xylanilytica]|uniref:Saccharopine dehydrogenase [NAD(+), L-lysine-forming] n=1 Tax=Neolewinella xylanilytica TaxID=1514080 RepID=A0A2S6I6E3_9BACT|nr:NAD(P)-dependent oxidoreductase [Neolewinella xylanilytica]PPK86710.1 alanine dehydrogenase [Neolewinella xylanilytica]